MNNYSIQSQLSLLKNKYKGIKLKERDINSKTVQNCVLSAIAVFSLKFPSLLQFDRVKETNIIAHNLRTLYYIEQAPSDTYMREVLDELDPVDLRIGYKALFRELQIGKKLQQFSYFDGYYLLSIDGTGYFSSQKISCDHCCEKHHRNGTTTFHHNMLTAALVHPDIKPVIPLCPEPILKQDGDKKNDCEINASKRMLNDFRREHPKLKTIVIQDGLFSNAPHIKELTHHDLRFIIIAKSTDHSFLFKHVESNENTKGVEILDSNGTSHRYRYINNVPLNESNQDVRVNFLEYSETKENGDQKYFSWITDILITEDILEPLMKAGRARWKIENETFNTLKNQGYNFEHNFGHGYKNLSTNFAFFMVLAFLIDQIQLIGSGLFKKALSKTKSKVYLWFKIRSFFTSFLIISWKDLFLSISFEPNPVVLCPDTS